MKHRLKIVSAVAVATLLIGSISLSPIQSMISMANTTTVSSNSSSASSTASTTSTSSTTSALTSTTDTIKDITLAPGSNETQMDFNWQSNIQSIGTVTLTANGKTTTFSAANTGTSTMTLDPTTGAPVDSGFFANKVTATNLQPSTTYTYTLSNGTFSSASYTFKTGDGTANFSFLFAGDPQIGASGDITNDSNGWQDTLNKSLSTFNNINFLVSAGDQVNDIGTQEQLDGYLSPTQFTSLPMATTVGNHDDGTKGFSNYKDFFNMPNESTLGSTSYSPGDYWYTYGDTLFMDLNSNNVSAADHKLFMQGAIAQNPNAKWTIVTLHHSLYALGKHASDMIGLRDALTPVFDDLKIDVVLMGHDHTYARTYQMKAEQPVTNGLTGAQSTVTDPTGTLYLTADSATGSKYNSIKVPNATYAAVESQLNVPTISKIDMTPTSFTIKTYRIDTMAPIDSYTINKLAKPAPTPTPAPVNPSSTASSTPAVSGTSSSTAGSSVTGGTSATGGSSTTIQNANSTPKTGDNETMLLGTEVLTSTLFVIGIGYIIYRVKILK